MDFTSRTTVHVALLGTLLACGRVRDSTRAGAEVDASAEAGTFSCRGLEELPVAPRVSFVEDVLPLFARSCVQLPCHSERVPRADLYLGTRCGPAVDDPCVSFDESQYPSALTVDLVNKVLDNLVDVPSATAPAVARVAPGDPERSFLAYKIAGTHADQGFSCEPVDDSSWYDESPCGESMPYDPDGRPLCETSPADFAVIIQWIAEGAVDGLCDGDGSACRAIAGDCCDGTCRSLDTAEHCGACERTCPGGQVCTGGACACAEGMLWCGRQCVPSDTSNCGACGITCRPSEECIDGRCACPFEGIFCDGLCRIYDENHCGACGVVCPPGTECDPGSYECRCPSPQTLCGEKCVETDSDREHCGGCGVACAVSESCVRGACVELTTTCGTETCEGQDLFNKFVSACCPPDGGCGLVLADRFGTLYPDALPACVPLYTAGVDDSSCPNPDPLFPPCCSENGLCGLWEQGVPDVGCVETVEQVTCTAGQP